MSRGRVAQAKLQLVSRTANSSLMTMREIALWPSCLGDEIDGAAMILPFGFFLGLCDRATAVQAGTSAYQILCMSNAFPSCPIPRESDRRGCDRRTLRRLHGALDGP